ncbi:MAG: hypothetical protein R6U15_08315 [Candidatus Izemoplasmatales bacterium]
MNKEKIILISSVEEINGKKAIEIAKKKGICVDNPSISIFSSVLCEIEKPNANKIRLAEDAVYEAVDSLIGTQINFNHVGKGSICGFIFDAFINKKKQVCISCVFFKKIYSIEYEHAKKLFAKGELTMSYELTHDVDTTEKLSDGTRRIHDFYFTGAGLLLGEVPACDNAIVYEFAKKMENQRQELIFASQRNLKNVTKPKQRAITSILASLISQLNKTEEYKMEKPNLDNLNLDERGNYIVKIEEIKSKLSEELGELVKDWTDEDFQNEDKIAEARKAKAEEKAEEAQPEAKAEEKAEKTVIETEQKVNQKTTMDDEKKAETTETEYEIEVRRDGKVIRTEKSKNEVVYLFAQVEEIKSKYEKQINELKATLEVKNSEIAEVRANAEKIAKLKIEYANNEFVKEFKDEDWLSEEKIEEAKTLQAKKEKIEANKVALKDNEFAKDFTDEDYANDDKVENASLKAEKKASEEKIKELEAKTKEETLKEDETAEKKEDLETNHSEDVVAEKKEKNSLVSILKEKIKK